jgi:hypothetical protein
MVTQFMRDKDARKIQDVMAVKALGGNFETLQRLGINEAKVREILQESRDQDGFGEWNLSGSASSNQKLTEFESFLLSHNHLIIETPEVAAEIYAYREHILSKAPDNRHDPLWEEKWVPRLIMLSMAWEQMGPDTQQEAKTLARHYHIAYMD